MNVYSANGARFIAADDMIVRWERETRRVFEPVTFAWIMARLAENDGAFVDVGASTGWFTVPVALAGHEVIAFEPNRRAARRLADNIALNGLFDDARFYVRVHEVAASDKHGSAVFRYNPSVPLTSGGSLEREAAANTATETVQTVRLDDEVPERVAVIKIDVEGHEPAVLAGAAHILADCRPALVLEANTAAHIRALAAWCDANAYAWTQADERNMLCTPRS